MRVSLVTAGALILTLVAGRAGAQGVIGGRVLDDNGRPVSAASVAALADGVVARETTTDSAGAFLLTGLASGSYSITVRKVGFQSAQLVGRRLAPGQALDVVVTLTSAARQLSTIQVVSSPTSVDATTPAIALQLDREYTALLPSARTATSLLALVPGARRDQLWGAAPGVANNYQVDGVAMNHPGLGGDHLALSVDWIETLDVRGLGAGAEHGNFQGGVVNVMTRTGSNVRRFALRSNYESPELTASNFRADEQGAEQAGRRELAGEALGPILRDRLFYFVGGQYVARELRSPLLATATPGDFQPVREEHVDARGIAKLTWLPSAGKRVDLMGGFFGAGTGHAGINGVDDPTGLLRVTRPTAYAGLSIDAPLTSRDHMTVRVAGFRTRESLEGYGGPDVPGVRVIQAGRQPAWQNAAFRERRDPSSLTATAQWRGQRRLFVDHDLSVGTEVAAGRWREQRIRNGGLTWRPYPDSGAVVGPFDAGTWTQVGSDWGGEVRLDSDVGQLAVWVQDRLAIGSRVTVEPGLRYGRWSGFVRPDCAAASVPCYRFEAVRADGLDPRLGIAWDVTGRSTLALKAHWGRYHQGMYSLFFDRVAGAGVYANERFYYSAPPLATGRETFTVAQRDAPTSGFLTFGFSETVRDQSGRVQGYRQPYVEQWVLALEKSIGPRWKLEAVYTNRRNRDIVGLADLNLATNYTPIAGILPDNRFQRGRIIDPDGNRLRLAALYVPNKALQDYLADLQGRRQFPATIFGYDTAFVNALPWNPDVVLGAVPQAHRRYDQVSVMLRTVQRAWRAEGSLTGARLYGNVAGVAGYGTTGDRFSAGQFVNRNEAINGTGHLPDAVRLDGKVWASVRLPWSLSGGVVYTHVLGERFTPSFELLSRYTYSDSAYRQLPAALFSQVVGQRILLEPRGSRHYASRALLDVHLEWRAPRRAVVALDLFNALGEDALTRVKTEIDDSWGDPTGYFGAPRERAAPRTLRIGVRFESRP